MDELPTITIITPTHNLIDNELVDDFNILTTLLSRQSYPNIEHLIIDKASNDGTVQLLSDYKSKGYIQFYSEPDSGKFDALNKGIMRAKGEFVAFLNPSDFIHDILAIEEILANMEEMGADYSFGSAYALHPEGYILPFEPAILNVFQVVPCALQAMVFKKSVLAAENYFDTKLRNMADFDLVMRLVMKEYGGILYDKNYVTYKISKDVVGNIEQVNNETSQVYVKNFRSIYPLTKEVVEKITTVSEFPQDLLNKLSTYFPEESREDFFAACEEMHQLRVRAYNEMNGIETEPEEGEAPEAGTPAEGEEPQQPAQQPGMPPRPQMPGMPRPGMTPRPQMPGMSGQPMRQTNPQMPPRPHMPGMNQ
ncbi:glycosyltransferase [bacterium]|nr:glycosyltransferase [bacterium]